ncbi:MAG: aspartyl-tRNA(Asn)/glutamyl-tRNA(Gln) amidotransferase subunit A [Candidatus Paceibacteria bacterium]|jgi:aspartyl-tRNA(Asn)/glutamyl-tRNA(Gln) amidotransferase subunit A
MSASQPTGMSAMETRAAILRGDFTVLETVQAHLDQIEALNPQLNAFQSVQRKVACEQAATLDRDLAAGAIQPGPLFGVPVALKANMCMEGQETNCGSLMLKDYIAPYTASFVERLVDAGAIPIGVTEMDEFAMGSSGENSAYECPRNPWDTSLSAGGSSSGAAVAVAAGLAPIALGSDTGGSVRQPASFCGVFGLKPSYGRVSRYGLVAFGSSLDQVSPFARTVGDLEVVLEAISGHDPLDSTSLPILPFEPERPAELQRLVGLRVGVLKEAFGEDVQEEVRLRCQEQLETMKSMGAELVEVSLPHLSSAIPTYYVLATAEASSNLGRYDGSLFGKRAEGDGSLQGMFAATREAGFGDEVKRRILLGTYVLSAGYYDAWYGKAQKVRTLLRREFEAAFEHVDVIASPTTPSAAFALGAKTDDALAMYLSDLFTVPANLAGLPALSIPAGLTGGDTGLPVGLQLIGPHLGEGRLLRMAAALESKIGPLCRTKVQGTKS